MGNSPAGSITGALGLGTITPLSLMHVSDFSAVGTFNADGGIGKAFIDELLKREVTKLYISGINIEILNLIAQLDNRLIPIRLDITNVEDINLCVGKCKDVNIIINNAGIELKSNLLEINASNKFDKEIKVNFTGAMQLTNPFKKAIRIL